MVKRLEEIKERYRFYKTGYVVNPSSYEPQQIHADLQWLIKQVERVEEMERDLEILTDVMSSANNADELNFEVSRSRGVFDGEI